MKLRSRGTIFVLVSALLFLAPLSVALAFLFGPPDLRTRELVALSPHAADAVARRDLLSVLQPMGRFKAARSGQVDNTTFVTWPYETEYRYVCREDRITLGYWLKSHSNAAGTYWYNRREPTRIDAQPLFHIEQLPIPGFVPGSSYTATICDRHNPGGKATWLAATDDTAAVRAANIFRMAEDQVRAGKLTPGPCDRNGPDACRQWILSLDDLAKIESVEACATDATPACYVIHFVAGAKMTIVATIPADETYPITPTAIISIKVAQEFAVAF
jgi:hypothetical protein